MASDLIERLNYYQQQFLGVEDFEAEQAYHRDMRRRHNLGGHTWGIVAGLELVEIQAEGGGIEVYMLPGLAVDGFGREIVALAPYRLPEALFEPFRNQPQDYLSVWIVYEQEFGLRARGGFAPCKGERPFGRVRETYRLLVEPAPPHQDELVVAGRRLDPATVPTPDDVATHLSAPPDGAVPHQELPDDDDRPRWRVQLGNVLWDGQKLIADPAVPPRLNGDRRYLGSVAAEVVAPEGKWKLRDRREVDPLPPASAGVAAEVEGSLTVDRTVVAKQDVELHGGPLEFMNPAGADLGVPLTAQRSDLNNRHDLRVTLGANPSPDNRLVISPPGVENVVIDGTGAIQAVGKATVGGDLALGGMLDFDDAFGEKILLSGVADDPPAIAVGTELGTLYARSPQRHRWYVNDPADGGASDEMELSSSGLRVERDLALGGDLELDDQHGDRVILRGAKGDPNAMALGTESGTLYAKADVRHRWYVGTNHDGGASDEMELDAAGLSVGGLVNGRNMAADGAKLDNISPFAKNVTAITGQVRHLELIFPPVGYSIFQCQIILSASNLQPAAFDVNEFGVATQLGLQVFAVPQVGNHWLAFVQWRQEGHGGATGWQSGASIVADYLIVGVK